MPVASVRGVDINYEVLGRHGPWVALQPGGRRALSGVKPLAEKLAEAGNRVLIYDRRNCGASGVSFTGDSENEVWVEDLRELLMQLDALPAFIGGSSSGCRLALLLALRHPAAVCGLLLWRVTGGPYAAERLVQNYYSQYIDMAQKGGMAAVCQSEHFSEVIAANPTNRARLMAVETKDFIALMERWRRSFNQGADHPVIGLSPTELRSMTMPACIAPGNDRVHPRGPGQSAHRLLSNAEYHEVLTEDRPDQDVATEDWAKKEGLLAAIFIDFLRRQQRG
ncbi:MAG TPA: alpha/beta hydrolase [Stellaceae bacterium]|jgi:pimeloyl-ACP methyl ester carboxylesterase|nr:alpha/beta hydrolase [Stellaceae bacterium]